LRALLNDERLEVIAGKVVDVGGTRDGALVAIRRRGRRAIERLEVSRIISCKGVTSSPEKSSKPIVESLFAQGLARMDPLGIGMDVDPDCAIVDRGGRPSRQVFAIGPMSQAAFWEITAIPDIRLQAAELARSLLSESSGSKS